MFSTIFDKATSYFDRRALVSSFFPSLIFWIVVLAAFVTLQVGWKPALDGWDELSGTAQFLLLLAFFAWITFWSFMTSNFRMTLTRLFAGYWLNAAPFRQLRQWRCEYWQKRWRMLDQQDRLLGRQEAILVQEQENYKKLRSAVTSVQSGEAQTTTIDPTQIGQELDEFLGQLEAVFASSSVNLRSSDSISETGQKIRDWWGKALPWLIEAQEKQDSFWIARYSRLEKITEWLVEQVNQQHDEVVVERQSLYRDLSLYYPSKPSEIMPTRLGNVFRAVELYSWQRYRLDAIVVWPRLESSLPDTFFQSLQDAKVSFDLMTTLTAFVALFGFPLALWIAANTTVFLPWWVSLLLLCVALPLRHYTPAAFATLALILSLITPVRPLAQIQTLLDILVGISLLFWLSYQNAIQAALNYGEKIKSAIDLYRWKVLEGLHVQLPKDLEEERNIWQEIGGLLARNYPPASLYYRYIQQEQADKKDS